MSKHPIVHIEFSAHDRVAAAKFYTDVFNWKVAQIPEMNYATFEAEGGPGGGFATVDNQLHKAGDVLVYIGTDDIDATLARIVKSGGKIVLPKTEIPSIGWFAIFNDPTGNRVALYTGINQQA